MSTGEAQGPRKANNGGFWPQIGSQLIGRIVAGIIVAAVLGSAVYARYFGPPHAALVGEVTFGPYVVPRTVFVRRENGSSSRQDGGLQAEERLRELTSLYCVRFKNTGQLKAQGVMLSLPACTQIYDYQKTKSHEILPSDPIDTKLLRVGELLPKYQEVVVTVWCNGLPSRLVAAEIGLSHDGGEGTLIIREPAGPLARFLERNWWWFVALLLAPNIVVMLIILRKKSRAEGG